MSVLPAPNISRRPALPLVWVVPLIALAVGGWMVFRELRARGPEITIEFATGAGLEPGKTKVEFRGVEIGSVTAVELAPDLDRVTVTARLRRDAAGVARTGTVFWVARPEIGFSGVRGLDTLFTGARISLQPGQGPAATHFVGLTRPPPEENVAAGRAFLLQSDRLHSLAPGAPVYYREMKVGMVETSRLADDAASVLIRIRVQTPYVALVRKNSRFWVAGGPSFKMGLFGAELKSTSLEALFSGGAAFATPDGELAPEAEDGTVFPLSREPDKEWERWQPRIPIVAPESSPEQEGKVPAALVPTSP
ncbi:intermembrane transport protein PqiB [Opitutus terrae]|uniref:Mammalian cell entry related domain protein n=1 Tax=Opitutus terrae (strain DSM 11246 / JCM 15787 / PB90-1) TaxID=452637 RepID=B1ZMG9_OPITP|nr:MlaD family protein [Opitutus terrae]ACB73422.1 Mammalian cell entry related domain protein [Opitutus terrae PB90-1]